ncbi:hypothetical protein BT69DRAFT_862215 [Atractiella rhizophila]|nr:hypothetical protein BT69DRAFT_862215 [Atractiella rhizophila]
MRFPPSLIFYLFFSTLHTFHAHRSASRFSYRVLTLLPTLHYAILTALALPILLWKLWKGRRWSEWKVPLLVGVISAAMRHAELVTGVEEVEIGLIVALRVLIFPPLFQYLNTRLSSSQPSLSQIRLQAIVSLLFSITTVYLGSSAGSPSGFLRWLVFGTLGEFAIMMLEREWVRNGGSFQVSNGQNGGKSWWELLAKSAPASLAVSALLTYPYTERSSPLDPDYRFLTTGGAYYYNNWWFAGVASAYGITAFFDTISFFYLLSTPSVSLSADGMFNFLSVGGLFKMVIQLALDQQIVGRLGWMGGGRTMGKGRGNTEVWCFVVVFAFLAVWATSNGWIWKEGDGGSNAWSPQEEMKSIPMHSKNPSNDFGPGSGNERPSTPSSPSAHFTSSPAFNQAVRYLRLSLLPLGLFLLLLLQPSQPDEPRTVDIVVHVLL